LYRVQSGRVPVTNIVSTCSKGGIRENSHFFVHSFAVARNLDLSFFNTCMKLQQKDTLRYGGLRVAHRSDIGLERVIRARVVNLFLWTASEIRKAPAGSHVVYLDHGQHCSEHQVKQ
jgi:hypothetical protein